MYAKNLAQVDTVALQLFSSPFELSVTAGFIAEHLHLLQFKSWLTSMTNHHCITVRQSVT